MKGNAAILMLMAGAVSAHGAITSFTVDGADAPAPGKALTASAVSDSGTVSYSWYLGKAATGAANSKNAGGAFSYGAAVATGVKYTPSAAQLESMIRVVASDGSSSATNDLYFSKLPVVYIDGPAPTTGGKTGVEYDVDVRVQGSGTPAPNPQGANVTDFASGTGLYSGAATVKIRGNSSAGWVKKPWKLKLASKANLLGIDTDGDGKGNKHWVLGPNLVDQAQIRNTTAYRFSKNLGLVNMETAWVTVILNGTYQGIYQLCEHIRIGAGRVDIADFEGSAEDLGKAIYKDKKGTYAEIKAALIAAGVEDGQDAFEALFAENLSWVDGGSIKLSGGASVDVSAAVKKELGAIDLSGGYLFEMDNRHDEATTFQTPVDKMWVNVNSPEFAKTSETMMLAVTSLWQRLESACNATDGINAAGEHAGEIADMASMAAYWLTQEVFNNFDATQLSRWCYIDRGGKLTYGPAWDFDYAWGSCTRSGDSPTAWMLATGGFYRKWLNHPEFVAKAHEMYWKNHDRIEALVADGGVLDQYHDYLHEAGLADSNRWFYAMGGKRGLDRDSEIAKTHLSTRLEWMDRQFASVSALMSSIGSTYPRNTAALALSLENEGEADGALDMGIYYGKDAKIAFSASGAKTVDAYTNGIFFAALGTAKGTVSVPAGIFAKETVTVGFVSRNSSGAAVARNFATVHRAWPETAADLDVETTGEGSVSATMKMSAVALDTRATEQGNYRRLSAANMPLPFALSGDFSDRGAGAAYTATLANSSGESEWAAGDEEAVKDWNVDCPGTNTFTLALADGTELVARFGVSVAIASGGKSAEVGEDGLETVTVRLAAIPLDTRLAAGGTRVLADGGELLPFALSCNYGAEKFQGGAYSVRLANAKGDSEWASGTGETVKAWTPDTAGENTFTLTTGDGGTLVAVFDVSVALASGGTAGELPDGGASGSTQTVTMRLKAVPLDTRTAAGVAREIEDASEILPLAASASGFAASAGSGQYAITLAVDGAAKGTVASGSGERAVAWIADYAGVNVLTHTDAADKKLTATFVIPENVARLKETGEIEDGGTVHVAAFGVALDTRTAAGRVREIGARDEILPFSASGAGFASADAQGEWGMVQTYLGKEHEIASGVDETTVEWTEFYAGTNVITLVDADGESLVGIFVIPLAIAVPGDSGDIGADPVTVTIQLKNLCLDTRTAAGAVRKLDTQEKLDQLLPIAYSADNWTGGAPSDAASVSVAKDGGKQTYLAGVSAGEGMAEWKPAAAGTYAFVHSAGGKTETATFTIGAGLEYPGAAALDADGGLSWLYVSADPADASEWGYAGAEEYAAWPESVREAQTGDFTGVEVVDGGILLTFRARLAEAAGDTDLRSWAEASVASGKIAVMAARALGGEETPVALEVVAADALTVTLRAPLAAEGAAFYRLRIEE